MMNPVNLKDEYIREIVLETMKEKESLVSYFIARNPHTPIEDIEIVYASSVFGSTISVQRKKK